MSSQVATKNFLKRVLRFKSIFQVLQVGLDKIIIAIQFFDEMQLTNRLLIKWNNFGTDLFVVMLRMQRCSAAFSGVARRRVPSRPSPFLFVLLFNTKFNSYTKSALKTLGSNLALHKPLHDLQRVLKLGLVYETLHDTCAGLEVRRGFRHASRRTLEGQKAKTL